MPLESLELVVLLVSVYIREILPLTKPTSPIFGPANYEVQFSISRAVVPKLRVYLSPALSDSVCLQPSLTFKIRPILDYEDILASHRIELKPISLLNEFDRDHLLSWRSRAMHSTMTSKTVLPW